jgi:hypothetical protein
MKDKRVLALLAEQMDFLSASCERFDAGHLHEAKRIAQVLRVLLHDTLVSISLLRQVALKDNLRLLDTRLIPEVRPGKQIATAETVPFGMVYISIGRKMGYHPMLGKRIPGESHRWVPFEQWWTARLIGERRRGNQWSRKDFVLGMEGGSHVDPYPNESWVILRDESFGRSGGGERDIYLVQAVVRQIAFEVTESLERRVEALVSTGSGQEAPPITSGT